MTTLDQVLAMALANTRTQRIADAPQRIRAEVSAEDLAMGETSQVLAQSFAMLSRVDPPQVQEPMELLWRNAARARDGRLS